MFNRIKTKLEWLRHFRELDRMTSMEEFRACVDRVQPADFLFYERLSAQKRIEVASLLNHIGFSLAGKRAMDLGPAFGDSLDIFRERGASNCCFVECEPFFYTFNRLKHFEGRRLDYIKHLDRIPPGPYDLIWAKGAVSHMEFTFSRSLLEVRASWGKAACQRWVRRLQDLVRTDGVVVLCPWWPNDGTRRSTQNVMDHWFTSTLVRLGFEPLPFLPGHNKEPEYPVTLISSGRARELGTAAPVLQSSLGEK